MRRAVRLHIIIICISLLSGCGVTADLRDVAELQPIQTLGYDRSGGIVTLSASTGRGPAELRAAVLRGSGDTITEALSALRSSSEREDLFFAHIRYVVVGEEAARQGIGELLDWFERMPQTRLDVPLFITEGGEASALFEGQDEDGYEITSVLLSLQRDAERQGLVLCTTLGETARALSEHGCALCCAVRAEKNGEHVPTAPESITAVAAGAALLQGDALTAFADGEAARGLALLTVPEGNGSLTVPDGQGGHAAVTLTKRRTELTAAFLPDGTPELTVTLRCRGALSEVDSALPERELRKALDEGFPAALASAARAAVEFLRNNGADGLGMERRFRRIDGDRCAGLVFPEDVRFRLRVEAAVERSFDLSAAENLHGEGRSSKNSVF